MRENILKWVRLISSTQALRDKRAKDLFDFIEWAVMNIPYEVRKKLGMFPHDGSNSVELTQQDLLWWQTRYKTEKLLVIRPIEEIETYFLNKIMQLCDTNFLVTDQKMQLEQVIAEMHEKTTN